MAASLSAFAFNRHRLPLTPWASLWKQLALLLCMAVGRHRPSVLTETLSTLFLYSPTMLRKVSTHLSLKPPEGRGSTVLGKPQGCATNDHPHCPLHEPDSPLLMYRVSSEDAQNPQLSHTTIKTTQASARPVPEWISDQAPSAIHSALTTAVPLIPFSRPHSLCS